MAKVKIFLDKDETLEEVEDGLFKALGHQASGDVHHEDSFQDPAMNSVVHRMEAEHKKIYQDMLNEIFMALEEEYLK